MAFPANFYRVSVTGHANDNGDYWEIGFHYALDGDTTGKTTFELAKFLAPTFWTEKGPTLEVLIPDNVTIDAITCKCVSTPGPVATHIVGTVGGGVGPTESIGAGPQIGWYGNQDPVLQGRSYFPGIISDAFDSMQWDAAFIAAADAFIAEMLTNFTIDGGAHNCIFMIPSYQIGVDSQIAIEGQLRSIPGTQRKRMRR